jgi:catechol 2,3-dioxygenase
VSGFLTPASEATLGPSVAVTSIEQHGGQIMSIQSSTEAPSTTPSPSPSVNHLVLNVRDIERSHRFYTELLGFEQCGELTHTMTMRFYRGDRSHHHDFALVQVNEPAATPAPDPWSMEPKRVGVNHIAIAYPDRESWLNQLRHLKANGVEFLVRGNHGMTHSAYIADPDGYGLEVLYNLPEEVWGGDVDAALNYFEYLPPDQDLEDTTDYQHFGEGAREPVEVPGRIVTRQTVSN